MRYILRALTLSKEGRHGNIPLQLLEDLMLHNDSKRQVAHKILFTIMVPLDTPPLNQQSDGFSLESAFKKGPHTELPTLSQNCKQTLPKLRTNRIMSKRGISERTTNLLNTHARTHTRAVGYACEQASQDMNKL